ncbi:MAG: hypothetical protein HYS98_01325 [Deltaproteobacteria bacterium]|nr:hypothetical protein [Deltaproteobacteria bacterium]
MKLFAVLLFLILFIGCTSTQEMATVASSDISDESYRYAQVLELSDKKVLEAGIALSQWHDTLRLVYDSTDQLVERLEKKPQERDKMKDDLSVIEEGLINILKRKAFVTVYVPKWDYSVAHSWALSLKGYTNGLKRLYRKLYNQNPEFRSVTIQVKLDDRYYDTYNDCLDVFQTTTILDPYRGYCMSEAQRYCGHQLNTTCVRRTILQHSFEAARDGSFCAEVEYEDVKDLEDIVIEKKKRKIVSKKNWISDIQYCQSEEPILKKSIISRGE